MSAKHSLDRLDLRYTFPRYTGLQSLVKCLNHRGTVLVLDTVCSQARVVLGCAMHCLQSIHISLALRMQLWQFSPLITALLCWLLIEWQSTHTRHQHDDTHQSSNYIIFIGQFMKCMGGHARSLPGLALGHCAELVLQAHCIAFHCSLSAFKTARHGPSNHKLHLETLHMVRSYPCNA